jgi:hypothetical protein
VPKGKLSRASSLVYGRSPCGRVVARLAPLPGLPRWLAFPEWHTACMICGVLSDQPGTRQASAPVPGVRLELGPATTQVEEELMRHKVPRTAPSAA